MRENRSTEWMRGSVAVVRVGFVVTMLTISMAAQKQAKNAVARPTTLAQAVVVEIYEHNLGKAMEMYRAIASDSDRTAETRTQARLRLAKAYRRLGQNTEAEASLRRAAGGTGIAAKEAASILAGTEQDDGDLVKAKVQQALMAMRLTGKPDRSDLAWIGRAAVPYVVKAVDGEKADLRFITNASTVLFKLGGPEVLKWIGRTKNSTDVLRKRAVIKGFRSGDMDVKRELTSFLSDADATVRREVMDNASRFLTASKIIDALGDSDERVRSAAMALLRNSWTGLDHGGEEFANFVRILPNLELEKEPSRRQNFSGMGSLWGWVAGQRGFPMASQGLNMSPPAPKSFPSTDAGRRAVLRALTFACFKNSTFQWPALGGTEPKNAYATELLATATKIGPVVESGRWGNSASVSKIMRDVLPSWDHASVDSVLQLVDLGYDYRGTLAKWVSRIGTAEDLTAVADRLHKFDPKSGVRTVCDWMTKVGAPATVLSRLTVLADKFHASMGKRASSEFRAVLRTIISINSPKSIDYVVARIQGGSNHYLLGDKKIASAEKAILLRLLVLPGQGDRIERARASAFQTLIQKYAEPGAPMLFARSYELGLGDSGPCFDPNHGPDSSGYRGVCYAYMDRSTRGATARVAVIEACLGTGHAEAFKDLARGLPWTFPGPVADAVSRHIIRCPKVIGSAGTDMRSVLIQRVLKNLARGEVGAQLAIEALQDQDPAVRRIAIRSLRSDFDANPNVAKTVLASLEDKDVMVRNYAAGFLRSSNAKIEGLVAAMTARLSDSASGTVTAAIEFLRRRKSSVLLEQADALLAHANSTVRYSMADALLTNHGAKMIAKVGPLLADEGVHKSYRIKLVKSLGSLMDLAVVPFLLQALKSKDLQVEAQKQLKAVRFYHEESGKWDRVLKGSGFGTKSAAEALIDQATSGKLEIRLAAIASLATLAEAATLPFLVKLIGDDNADIAGAAKDAVNRINQAARKK